MRFSTLFLAFTLAATLGCGNSKSTDTEKKPPLVLPPIVKGPVNAVSYAEGELLDSFAFAQDPSNKRILMADQGQGIVAVDETTKALTVLFPMGKKTEADTVYIKSIADIALDEAHGVLYILDTSAKQILAADLTTLQLSVVAVESDFTIGDKFVWSVPTSIEFDTAGQRLLIGDASGFRNALNSTTNIFNAFCLFEYSLSTQKISVVSQAANLAAPLINRTIEKFHYDADNNRLFVSGIYYPTGASGDAAQAISIINVQDWGLKSIYLNPSKATTSSQQHGITYDKALDTVYFIESNGGNIISIDISDKNPNFAYAFLVSNSADQNYRLFTPTDLQLHSPSLWVLDRATRTLLNINQQDGTRTPLFSGVPITASALDRPIYPTEVGIDPDDQSVFIVDGIKTQRNALTLGNSAFSPHPYSVDMTGITGAERKLEAPAEGKTTPPASITEPKILLSQVTPSGALITFNELFERETTQELVRTVYYSTFYKRAAKALNAVPLNTVTKDGITRIIDLSSYFGNVDAVTLSGSITGFGATDSEILMVRNSKDIYLINYVTSVDNDKLKYVAGLGEYSPQNITGITLNPINGEYLIIDAYHDALLSINTDNKEKVTIKPISGREITSDVYLSLPAGLAFDASTNTAYTFDNAIKAVVAIDVGTGARHRLNSAINYINSASQLRLSADNTKLYIVDTSIRRVAEFNLSTYEQRWIDTFAN